MTDYPPGMTLRPIEAWPHAFTKDRRRSPFSATLTSTVGQLNTELRHLSKDGRPAPSVLQIAMREQDFRLDGMPRAHAVPEHPGVILAIIESKHGPLSYPCDTFTHWRENLRAIALGLEALRRVERYGITQTGQQYRGWQALTEKAYGRSFTADTAETYLRSLVGDEGDGLDLGTLQQVYRRAARITHPDRNDGDRAQWNLVEQAAVALRAAGRLS